MVDQLEGVPAKQIAKPEHQQGVQLPEWYRTYLETIGGGFSVVRYYQDIDLRPKALHKWLARNKWRSHRYLLVGLSANGGDFDLYADLGDDGHGISLVSFQYPGSEPEPSLILPMATQFSTYLMAATAVRVISSMPSSGRAGAGAHPTKLLPALRRRLACYGAEEHPLSGAWDKIFVGPRVVAVASERPDKSLSISLGCMAVDEWWEIAGRLEHELKLRIARSPG